ncbi:MAG: energy transducer TonB [Candidatus Endonucleobacter sp. (ex Gigantidas childressi)]|nr:energy transducer TonB [Candidatus Endonucleobacter sp. (ex Gigantidas childressi)]
MNPAVKVSANDRLSFTVFIAVIFHALIILGISFTVQDKPITSPTLEVTLAVYQSKDKPKDADYIAQLNQHGGGSLDEKALPTTNKKPAFQDENIHDTQQASPSPPPQKESTSLRRHTTVVVTLSTSKNKSPDIVKQEIDPVFAKHKAESNPVNLKEEIASLEALLKKERQTYAKRLKIKRLTAASTAQEAGAYYKETWRRKVEKVGNLYYPERARAEELYGELSLMVTIDKNGTLHDVEIIKSSGLSVLDEAAIRTVRLAAPFSPFDDDLKDYDLLEIIRTWRFEPEDQLSSN